MNLEFFRYLPSEIFFEILSRLPIRTIVVCKCVCKSWLDLLQTRAFADFHLSKSVPGLAVCEFSKNLKIFEFEDKLDLEFHDLHYNPVTEYDCRKFIITMSRFDIKGSANGLLFLRPIGEETHFYYICNPITREYIELPKYCIGYSYGSLVSYGFGVSKMTGRYC